MTSEHRFQLTFNGGVGGVTHAAQCSCSDPAGLRVDWIEDSIEELVERFIEHLQEVEAALSAVPVGGEVEDVEAAARALAELGPDEEWENMSPSDDEYRDSMRDMARAALDAVHARNTARHTKGDGMTPMFTLEECPNNNHPFPKKCGLCGYRRDDSDPGKEAE